MSYFDNNLKGFGDFDPPDDPPEPPDADEMTEEEIDEWYETVRLTPAQRRQEMGGEYGGDGADD